MFAAPTACRGAPIDRLWQPRGVSGPMPDVVIKRAYVAMFLAVLFYDEVPWAELALGVLR